MPQSCRSVAGNDRERDQWSYRHSDWAKTPSGSLTTPVGA